MENLNKEGERKTNKEMTKRKCKIEKKKAENLNREREGRTEKEVRKRERKKEKENERRKRDC